MNRVRGRTLALTAALFMLLSALPLPIAPVAPAAAAEPRTLTVDKTGQLGFVRIQDAVTAAKPGDTVHVLPGEYFENVYIEKALTLRGSGAKSTIVNGSRNGDVIKVNAQGVAIEGLSIRGSAGGWDYGGVWMLQSSDCRIFECNISDNYYGVFMDNCTSVVVENSTFFNQKSAVYLTYSTGCTISNNTGHQVMQGIFINNSVENTVLGNVLTTDLGSTVVIKNSGETLVAGNDLYSQQNGAVSLYDSWSNTVNANELSSTYFTAVQLSGSRDIIVTDNNCTRSNRSAFHYSDAGIYAVGSSSTTIRGNDCNSTWMNGIRLSNSEDFEITGNVFNGTYTGIYLVGSIDCTFAENVMPAAGLRITGDYLDEWRTHEFDSSNTINGSPVQFLRDLRGGSPPEPQGQLILVNCSGMDIADLNLSGRYSGIALAWCDDNNLSNLTCIDNRANGIELINSNANTLMNLTCLENGANGIELTYSDDNVVEDTICSATGSTFISGTGINLYHSSRTVMRNVTCTNNTIYGVSAEWSDGTVLRDSNCTGNGVGGIFLSNSDGCIIDGSTFVDNRQPTLQSHIYGICLMNAQSNTITSNTALNNSDGIYISQSNDNNITGNVFSNNYHDGIDIIESTDNVIANNTCEYNGQFGIALFSHRYDGYKATPDDNILTGNVLRYNNWSGLYMRDAFGNVITDNLIAYNSGHGINITDDYSEENLLYHNNIIGNEIQAFDEGNNVWQSMDFEGNHWSDYEGADNGEGGRYAGDGIGDTLVPHAGLDLYPFVSESGWLCLGIPELTAPVNDRDGQYIISWNAVRGLSYVLEEDNGTGFSNASLLYRGPDLHFNVTGRPEGTYRYRIKAVNDKGESEWGEVVAVTVDHDYVEDEGGDGGNGDDGGVDPQKYVLPIMALVIIIVIIIQLGLYARGRKEDRWADEQEEEDRKNGRNDIEGDAKGGTGTRRGK